MDNNYFTLLNAVNVNDKIEKKNGLTYLSWAWAWGEVKKRYPDATYTIYENADGWNYHTDGKTCWVKTGVTVNGIEHIEYLPVMDVRNRSIPVGNVTSFDVNKTIQRSLTKAVARHGLGLYIYAGEDLPEEEQDAEPPKQQRPAPRQKVPAPESKPVEEPSGPVLCVDCGREVTGYTGKTGAEVTAEHHISITQKMFGVALCRDCAARRASGKEN